MYKYWGGLFGVFVLVLLSFYGRIVSVVLTAMGVPKTVAVISRLKEIISRKVVMRMTTEMFVNILALIFTVLSTGISIGLYIANKKNDR